MVTVKEKEITELTPSVEPVGLLLGVVLGALVSIFLNISMMPKKEETEVPPGDVL